MRQDFVASEPGMPPKALGAVAESGPGAGCLDWQVKASVVVIDNLTDLRRYKDEWEDLAREAIEPNVFYEPCLFLPAAQHLAEKAVLKFVLVFLQDAGAPGRPMLCGFFPLEYRKRYKGLPISVSRLWKHVHCFLCTPLVRTTFSRETVSAFFDWVTSGTSGSGIIELNTIPEVGPFSRLLQSVMEERRATWFVTEQFSRGFARTTGDPDEYLKAAISSKGRRELSRKERHLSKLGQLEYRQLESPEEPGPWIEAFLQLEQSGWKGRQGTAIACDQRQRLFFASSLRQAFEKGSLIMLSLHLSGVPIAIQCCFVSGDWCFAFKTAYDERFSPFSPGILLQIETIRRLHSTATVSRLDSCGTPENLAINRVCTGRRDLQDLIVHGCGISGQLLVGSVPILSKIKRGLSGRSPGALPSRTGKASATGREIES